MAVTGHLRQGLIGVIRTRTPEEAEVAAIGLSGAGVRTIEITCTIPGAPRVIERVASQVDACVGAGTVLSLEMARQCREAGARFLVAPETDEDLVRFGLDSGLDVVPGALTPNEIRRAFRLGAPVVKVFPIGTVGGASYIRTLLEPYPDLRLAVSGGIKVSEVKAYMDAGVWCVCLGSALLDREATARGDVEAVQLRAREVVAELESQGVAI